MFPRWGTHITRDICFLGGGTHITRDMCSPPGKHISLGICVSRLREHILLGICVAQVGKLPTRKNMQGMIKTISFSFFIKRLFSPLIFFLHFSNNVQAAIATVDGGY